MSTTAPHVAWTSRAEGRLRNLIDLTHDPAGLNGRMTDLGGRLALAFPDATDVIGLDLFQGFQPRRGEFILLADVRRHDGARTYIVKLADDPERLVLEHHTWVHTKPPNFDGDQVFMRQELCPGPDDSHKAVALLYQDAHAHIGLDRAVPLEEAFLGAVRFGHPDPASIGQVIDHLFDRMRHALYNGASPEEPGARAVGLSPDWRTGDRRKLADILRPWQEEPDAVEARQQVNTAFPVRPPGHGGVPFTDPADFIARVVEDLAADVPPARWVPSMVRGPAHGDLHARNVLVGLTENEARWPALYDYEHMSRDNLVAWDFVKLETELKTRGYRLALPADDVTAFVEQVATFEQELRDRTEQHSRDDRWPTPGGAGPRERLMTLLLAIRRQAAKTLQRNGRLHDGLAEYDFLLGCYGLHTGRFASDLSDRAAVFTAAGVAVGRYWLSREPDPALSWGATLGDSAAAVLDRRDPDYRKPLWVAYEWNRSGDHARVAKAHDLLKGLCERHPNGIQVWYELAFGLVKMGRRGEALRQIQGLCRRFKNALDEDTFCLWGRCLKDEADERLTAALDSASEVQGSADLEEADRLFQDAIVQYQLAYNLHKHWFPGINVATLTFVRAALARRLGREDRAEQLWAAAAILARQLLAAADGWTKRLADDNVWILATRAEAHLLQQKPEWEHAEVQYRAAIRQRNRQPHHLESMNKQVKRILTSCRLLKIDPQGRLANPDTFFVPTESPTGAPS